MSDTCAGVIGGLLSDGHPEIPALRLQSAGSDAPAPAAPLRGAARAPRRLQLAALALLPPRRARVTRGHGTRRVWCVRRARPAGMALPRRAAARAWSGSWPQT